MDNLIPFNRYPSMRKFVYTVISTELCYKQCKRISKVNNLFQELIEAEGGDKVKQLKDLIEDTTTEEILYELIRLILLVFCLNAFNYFFISRRVLKHIKT